MEDKLQELKRRLAIVQDLRSAAFLLSWDELTQMPPGGAPARGRQIATLRRLEHEHLTDAEVGRLLDELQPLEEDLPYDSDDASLLRMAHREFERAIRVPSAFLQRLFAHATETYHVWAKARPANDFGIVLPLMEEKLDLSRQYASYFPEYEHPADAWIEFFNEGMTAEDVSSLFARLREQLVPLVEAITAQPLADDACLHQTFPENEQLDFGRQVIADFGYDFDRGRQDKTLHPFMTRFSIGDVRITTRVKENNLSEALFSTLHEAGHALYEQGVDPTLEGTILARGASGGLHESQSRLWENLVGRSPGFWSHYYPKLQAQFPQQMGNVPEDNFYRAINKVVPSLIRTDADEVTYNLHVMMRFDFELALLDGRMAMADLPDAWRERLQADLGVAPQGDADGVLQDVHWYHLGIGGMFQGYTIGNIASAQFFEAALRAHPEIPEEIAAGRFGTLHAWLRDNLYRHGRKYTSKEVLERATGSELTIEPYMRYLRKKYSELYRLDGHAS